MIISPEPIDYRFRIMDVDDKGAAREIACLRYNGELTIGDDVSIAELRTALIEMSRHVPRRP